MQTMQNDTKLLPNRSTQAILREAGNPQYTPIVSEEKADFPTL
jgi:hypothetical protein